MQSTVSTVARTARAGPPAPGARHGSHSAFFRGVNDSLISVQATGDPAATRLVVCECSRSDCTQTLEISDAEYEAVRAHPTRFIVNPGHETTAVQRVLFQTRSLAVVQEQQQSVRIEPPARGGRSRPSAQPPVVLVVDDDPAIRLLCAINLQS